MSNEEIKTCVLKVNIHCDGCKLKVKKILQKVDGVFTTAIDSEQGKVTIAGNVDPSMLIRKLNRAGKHAEIWGCSKKPSTDKNAQNLEKQFKGMQIGGNPKGLGGINGKGSEGGSHGNKLKEDGGGVVPQVPSQKSQQQQKEFQNMRLPQFKEMNVPPFGIIGGGNPGMKQSRSQGQKHVRFCLPEEDLDNNDDFNGDDADDFDDDYGDFDYDDEFDDEMRGDFPRKAKNNEMMNRSDGPHPLVVNPQKGGNNTSNNDGKNGGNGGSGDGAFLVTTGGGNGGKKVSRGGASGNNCVKGNGGKNGNGGLPQKAKMGGNSQGGKKGNGGGFEPMSNGPMAARGPNLNPMMGNSNLGPMGGLNPLAGQTGHIRPGQTSGLQAVHGLPGGPGGLPSNPYQQQQYLSAVMNQQPATGNERFQPMMYARPPPATNYAAPNSYSYPYLHTSPHPSPYAPPPYGDSYEHVLSDDNTSSCTVM